MSRNELVFLISCCIVSFLIQLYFLYKISPDSSTSFEHGLLADGFARGEGFYWRGQPTAYREPLYVLYLAFLRTFYGWSRNNFMFSYYIHLLVTCLYCFPVYKLAKFIFSPRVAVISVLVLITDWQVIIQNFYLLPEVFFAGVILLLLLSLYKIETFQLKRFAVYSGILLGIGALLKGVILSFFPCALLWIFTRRQIKLKKRLTFVLLISAFTALTLSPWIIRNYLVFKKFVPANTSFGPNLYVGNNEGATGSIPAITGEAIILPTEEMRIEMEGMSEVESSEYLTQAALDYIRRNPRDFFILRLKALFYFWFTYNYWSESHPIMILPHQRMIIEFPRQVLVLFNLLTAVGVCVAIRNRNSTFLIVALAVAFSLVYSLTHADHNLRYCATLHPILTLFVANALYETYLLILRKWRKENDSSYRQMA